MGILDKALKTVKNVGDSLAESAVNVGSSAGTSVQENAELNSLKMQINVIEQELDAAYVQIGKKYVDYVVKTGDMGNLDIADLLTMMDPKLTRKQELEEQLVELEKRMKQNAVLREKAKVEAEFAEEKTKLDRALAMDVITQDEYNFKISVAKKKTKDYYNEYYIGKLKKWSLSVDNQCTEKQLIDATKLFLREIMQNIGQEKRNRCKYR